MTADFQSQANKTGRSYADSVAMYLESMGFSIIGRDVRHPSGVQFDIHATDRNGFEVGIECKSGSETSKSQTPGLARTDNVWKVGGYLHQLAHWTRKTGEPTPRYIVATSHRPRPGTIWAQMLDEWQLYGDVEFMVIPHIKETDAA